MLFHVEYECVDANEQQRISALIIAMNIELVYGYSL